MSTNDRTFDPNDPDFVRSPWETYRWLRDEAPFHRAGGDPGYRVLSRFDDVTEAARDHETFSSASGLTFSGGDIEMLGLVPTIVMMDPPSHTAYRRLVTRGFTPRAVADLEPAIRDFVGDRFDALEAEMAASGSADFIATVAKPLPSFVVATYLGVPAADRDKFDGWSSAIVSANASGSVIHDAREAVGELYAYFIDLVAKRRSEPADDMISELAHAELDGDALSVESILGYAFVMIAGGNDTTTGLLGGAAELLTRFRDQRATLLGDPSLVGGAIDELLRLTSPVQGLSRTLTRDVSFHGETAPAGSKVHLLYAAANRDPRAFGDDAEQLDVLRRPERILSFTTGPHHCLGAAAARLQGRVALSELLRRMPDFEVLADRGRFAPGAFVRRYEYLPITR